MRPFTLTFFLLLSGIASAQSGFYARTIDFSRPENARWEHPPHENLGAMLLDAHLRGKLKAYKFDVAHDELKYAPIPKKELAAPWDPKLDYYAEDIVSHNGVMYLARFDISRGARPPDSLIFWENLNMHGPVVSYRHHFPTVADTTPKSFLLSQMIEQEPEGYDPWMEDFEYYSADRVAYQGKMYVAMRDKLKGVIPETNQEHWQPLPAHVTMFQPTDLNVIRVLFHYEVKNGDTVHTPQMVSARVIDPFKEVSRDVGLNFFYNDVVKFLENSSQPALYLSEIGHVGGGAFLFDDHAKENFTRWVQSKIISKEIKPDKKSILSQGEYDLFLMTKPEDISHTKWYPVQNLLTKDLTIIAGKLTSDYDYYTVPMLFIPYASIDKLIKLLPPPRKPRFYKDIFTDTSFFSWNEIIEMDSIEAMPAVAHAPDAFRQNYFDEIQFDYTDANPITSEATAALWDVISQNKTKFHSNESYYPCHFNWKGTEARFSIGQFIADENFTVSHVTPPPSDLPKPHWRIKEIGVVYRINLNPATERFHPRQLVISFEEEAHADLIDYRIDWEDVVKLTAGKKEFDLFVDGVKKGSLNFKQTAIAYNQIMIR